MTIFLYRAEVGVLSVGRAGQSRNPGRAVVGRSVVGRGSKRFERGGNDLNDRSTPPSRALYQLIFINI